MFRFATAPFWAILGASACTVACAAAADPEPLRVLVKLVQPSQDTALIVRQASAAAGTPVRYVAAVSLQWHGLALDCGSDAACADAMDRLRADAAHFSAVERDQQSRPLSSPRS